MTSASAPPSAPVADEPAAMLPDCDAVDLATVDPGFLTVAAVSPDAPPWLSAAADGQLVGLEADIVQRLGEYLGYRGAALRWTRSPEKADLEVGGLVAPESDRSHDWSAGYFDDNDALVKRESDSQMGTLPPETLRFGYVAGGTGSAVAGRLATAPGQSFDDSARGLEALATGSLDVMVVALSEAVMADESPELQAVGQIGPVGKYQASQWRLRLPANSSLTGCVNAALDRMRVEGELDEITSRWVTIPSLTVR